MIFRRASGRCFLRCGFAAVVAVSACSRAASSGESALDASPQALSSADATPAQASTSRVILPRLGSADTDRDCRDICSRSVQLKCAHPEKCLSNCVAMASTPCSEPMQRLYKCLIAEPAMHWECAEDGVAAIRDGFCNTEQGQTVACMEAKMKR